MSYLFEVFDRMTQTGPGSDASSRRALRRFSDLPDRPRIADFGCGPGRTSLLLARETQGEVIAIESHAPCIDALARRAEREGLSRYLFPMVADMGQPPIAPKSLDLIWSEGAIYFLGFQRGLELWRPLLKTRAGIAVTEITWLTDHPSPANDRFWRREYPAMQSLAANVAAVEQAGYELIETFTLPPEDWSLHYYTPLQVSIDQLRADHPDEPLAQQCAAILQAEIDLYGAHGTEYGYVFYLARMA
ncbi:MAG: class I SAM-dependent methyltransferase [Gammaproteobacteria bacterium]|nr:class I SAM-dependent methyltransferase [Gammaproteobacteria bacterium]